MSKTQSVLQLVKGQEQYIKDLPLEDGRLSFAVDSKKIYMDCDFEDLHGMSFQDRISFGGNSGIYYGNKTFSTAEIEESMYVFEFPDNFNGNIEQLPNIDDIIINTDGCFYRVLSIENNSITTSKLTVAGSGGGGGMAQGIIVAKDPNQSYNIIAENHSIPIGFKVTDTIENTTIDVEVTINDVRAGIFRNVNQNVYTSIDLYKYLSYFTMNNTNTVKLRLTNEYDHAATLTLTNIRIISLELNAPASLGVVNTDNIAINFQPYGGSSMYARYLNVQVFVQNTANPLIVQKIPYGANIDNGEIYVYNVDLTSFAQGNYTIFAWVSALPEQGDTTELTSPQVRVSFTYQSSTSNTPMLSMSLDKNNYEQYETAEVNYLVAYNGTNANVHLYAYCNNQLMDEQQASVIYNTNHIWHVLLTQAGNWSFIVEVTDYNLSQTIADIIVSQQEIILPVIDTTDSSLVLYLNALGRSNNETHPDTWNYKNVNCTFENFNWDTNGWITDENQITSLHLTNGAKLTVPYSVFEGDCTDPNSGGKAIEIIYKLSNIRDENAIFIKAASEYNNVIRTGIIGTGSIISLNTRNNETYKKSIVNTSLEDLQEQKHNGLQAYIGENERIHIVFSIQTKNTNNSNANFIYTYMNGVLSSLKQYDNSDHIQEIATDPSHIIIDSTYGDIDIYSIRVYNKYIADSIVLNNYAADLPTVEQKMFIKNNNDVLVGGTINLNKVAELGNIPYLVVTDLREVKDKKASTGIIGQTQGITTGKKDFRWCPCYYVDPEDKNHIDDPTYIKRSFGSPTELVEAVMYGQGTSSMAFPVKNFRLRFKNKSDKYSLRPAVPLFTQAEAEKWEALPKVALFTFKADYMDSSMSHNTGTGNALAALYDSIGLKTPAQLTYPNRTICNNVVGSPCIVFWRTGEIGTETYIGRYNFNTDKAEHELFGFFEDDETNFGKLTDSQGNLVWGFQSTTDESKYWDGEWNEEKQKWDTAPLKEKTYYIAPDLNSEWQYNGIDDGGAAMQEALKNGPLYEYVEGPRTIQCWEFLDNSSALDNFRTSWNEFDHPNYDSKTSWVTSFESRYPEHQETQYGSTDKKYQYCTDFRAFTRLINWLNSTNQMQATNEAFDNPVTILGRTYNADTKEYRLAKFKSELNQYMEIDFTIFYYILTQVLLMVDSRAKNMMMCSYNINVNENTGTWFPIFYDMDTILGVNNQGSLVFNYSENDATTRVYNAGANYGRYDENDQWIPNTEYSVLWCNLREGFADQIASKYQDLRRAGKLSVNYLLQCYNTQQSGAFAEIYDNQDGIYKYIRPLTEQSKVLNLETEEYETTTSNYLYVEQGTREFHRKMFLTKRLNLLDTMYHYYSGEDIYIRANGITTERTHPNPHPYQFTFTTQDYQYGTYVYGRATSDTELLPNVPTLSNMPVGETDTANNLEVWLYNLNSIYDIGDLSDKFAENIDIKHPLKLRTLKVGNSDPAYHYKTKANMTIAGLNNLPLLESIDISKIIFATTTLDLSNNVYLRNVYAKGSNLTSLTLASGANIQHLELPSSLNTLALKDFLFYDTINHPENLQIENYSNITTINIEGCPRVNSQILIEEIMAQDTNAQRQLINVRLPDINWRIDTIDNTTCDLQVDTVNGEQVNIINDIKILDYVTGTLEATNNLGQTITPALTNNEYFGGTIIINNNNCLANDLALKNKYSAKFPGLNIVYTNSENLIAGYDIIIHNAQTGDKVYPEGNKRNSITIDASEAIGFNLKNYLENDVSTPSIDTDIQYTYTFRGWSYVQPYLSYDTTVLNNALYAGVEMTETNGVYTASANCPTSLANSDYVHHELHLYPIFEMKLRKYTISFMYNEQSEDISNDQLWIAQQFEYGSQITLPTNLPAVIDLNPDNDNDKSKTTIRLLNTYQYNNRTYDQLLALQDMKLYPVYDQPLYMDQIIDPPTSYFDTIDPTINYLIDGSTFIDDNNTEQAISSGIEAIIKEDVTVEAICVPKMINNKYVVSIKNRSPHVKRVYFESGSKIKYIAGNAGFNGSAFGRYGSGDTYSLRTTGIYELDPNGNYYRSFEGFVGNGPNHTLEYVDLGALTQLTMLGGKNDVNNYGVNDSDSRVFAYCPELYIKQLPDSIKVISPYCFAEDINIAFSSIPDYIIIIGNNAFYNCTGLTKVNFNPLFTADGTINRLVNTYNNSATLQSQWPIIGSYAFYNCNNLNLVNIARDTLEEKEVTFQGVQTIGDFAFYQCSELIMSLSSTAAGLNNNTLKYIGNSAFQKCSKLNLNRMPASIIHIGQNAFANLGNLPSFSDLPKTIRYMGQGVFYGDTLAQQNAYNLVWSFPATLNNDKSIVEVVDKALQGARINKLTFNFNSSEFDSTSAAETFVDTTYKTLEPWSIAWSSGVNHAFGAVRVNDNSIPVDISTRLDSRERG